MGIDLGTLLRSAGQGVAGHKAGLLEREDRAAQQARDAQDEETQRLRQQSLMLDIQAQRNPAPATPFRATVDGVSSNFETEEGATGFVDRNRRPETPRREPNAPRPFSATNLDGVRGTFATAEEANAFAGAGGGGVAPVGSRPTPTHETSTPTRSICSVAMVSCP